MPTRKPSDAQDPYASILVEASAGSGKTYQLSKRFINLVAAGAPPQSILTITFTVKAAQEMRNRIIQDATRLLTDPQLREQLDNDVRQFYQRAKPSLPHLRSPKPAMMAAKDILSVTQSLRISTIDALFNEWVARFTWESGLDNPSGPLLPSTYRIIDALETQELELRVWQRLFTDTTQDHRLVEQLIKNSDKGTLTLEAQLKELDRYHTYLWQLEHRHQSPLKALDPSVIATQWQSEQSTLDFLSPYLKAIASQTKRYADFCAAIDTKSLTALISSRLITRSGKVSGTIIRGANRERLHPEISVVEDGLACWQAYTRLCRLNRDGADLLHVYGRWATLYQMEKIRTGTCAFADLAKASYRLFTSPAGIGAVWLIQKGVHHLLLDEFQDTSLLQWSIFARLQEELLAGEGASTSDGIQSTAFLVGDRKQSIYGFREADPSVMDLARESFGHFSAGIVSLNDSYRTTQLILDVLNHFFGRYRDPAFPVHRTATIDGKPAIEDVGSFVIHEPFSEDSDRDIPAVEVEANYVAGFLARALQTPHSYPVFDRQTRHWRALRPDDCCVLYRNSTHADIFEQAMRRAGITTRREEKRGFFERVEIRDLMALMRYLAFPQDVLSLASFCQGPFSPVTDDQLLLALSVGVDGALEGKTCRSTAVLEAIERCHPTLKDQLSTLREAVGKAAGHFVLTTAIQEFQILDRIDQVFAGHERTVAKENVVYLLELAGNCQTNGSDALSHLVIALERLAEADNTGTADSGGNAVTMMTVHKSKGLEYPLVTVVEASEPWYRSDRYWLKGAVEDPGLYYVGRKDQQPADYQQFQSLLTKQEQQQIEESSRLLYVSLTRASQYLLVTGHRSPRKPIGPFFQDLLASVEAAGGSSKDGCTILARGLTKVHIAEAQTGQAASIQKPMALPKTKRRHDLTIISPHLVSDVAPSETVSSNRGQLPRAMAQALGTYIHKALELFVADQPWHAGRWWQVLVETPLIRSLESVSDAELQKLRHRANQEIEAVLQSQSFQDLTTGSIQLQTEVPLILQTGKYLMRGVCDLVVSRPNHHTVLVDYKTANLADPTRAGCLDMGFDQQLRWYEKAWKRMFPSAKVDIAIYLTKHRRLVVI